MLAFIVGSIAAIFWADRRGRRKYAQVNKRVSCRIRASVSLLGRGTDGTLTILGHQGFRFEFFDPQDRATFDRADSDLLFALEVEQQHLTCRLLYIKDSYAGFLFQSRLQDEEYESVLQHSEISPKSLKLTGKESKRISNALGRL